MFDVILYQPEIPPNTGNIIRLCANTGSRLHLVKPLGFTMEDKQLLRAGLDYHEFARIALYETWTACAASFAGRRLFTVSTKGRQRYDLVAYRPGDVFLFGPESRGLPPEILQSVEEAQRIRLPMVSGSRSLNLSNAVAVVIYEPGGRRTIRTGCEECGVVHPISSAAAIKANSSSGRTASPKAPSRIANSRRVTRSCSSKLPW
ncbi:MAG: RNA methyltransferase TrmH, group 2 [Nitrospira sp. OLB3]|nr:MAG: RNA methyltransferase TrmH, group 2 [Nitrospira sp. OLB3]